MPNRLAAAISPYLRSHADNPVDWHEWGAEAFAEARARDLPVLVSIGYSTCHWCHVMNRESFSDPALASVLNKNFVSIKVDREEHPDVDTSFLAAAGAFTRNLGWPLTVFVTPDGQAFYAGTYFPPQPAQGLPSFMQVLDAVTDAWTQRRDDVTESAARVAQALADIAALPEASRSGTLAEPVEIEQALTQLVAQEDTRSGGFGGAPKFPMAPTLGFLLDDPRPSAQALALRTLKRMGASPLRDPVEGGFFRYAVQRDWSEPHYERMLSDNAQLLALYTRAWQRTNERWARIVVDGLVDFLTTVLRLPSGGFASAQDSESIVNGVRVEGGYYALELDDRRAERAPALDEKVLTGFNGLAISALARAGFAGENDRACVSARQAADYLLAHHVRADGTLVRVSVDARISAAPATLEDYGMFARALLDLALVTGDVGYAKGARRLIDSTLSPASDSADAEDRESATALRFRPPGGGDPVLEGQGLAFTANPSDGAYPSGLTAIADAAHQLFLLTAETRYRDAARSALSGIVSRALAQPLAFGATLRLINALTEPAVQLVVVSPDVLSSDDSGSADPSGLRAAARRYPANLVTCVTESQARAFAEAGFALFDSRATRSGRVTAYLCRDFVCRLPVTDSAQLERN
ncbi:thioredoxin domain-containing protein [Glaciibacter psychrotolerans]|uniref:Spermatogenesis-associated protein 20-like TRX domain-containing protein n=1 Tax=Glaciibacter psychrotolerans TaxID=670054 RepID=A0A7Z0J4G0_9MICO|nr:thioredoxin domain-containing protein [Leifsonia psychrotolerans]NYJ18352.1 hypothetical protein [Leifsonia psychrotolerans]